MVQKKFKRKGSLSKLSQRWVRTGWLSHTYANKNMNLGLGLSKRLLLNSKSNQIHGFSKSPYQRSFWMKRFFNCLMWGGHRQKLTRYMVTVLWGLESLLYRDPALLVFEFFETYRYPFMAVQVKRGWTTFVKLTFLPWWRQYLTLMRWLAASLKGHRVSKSLNLRVFYELVYLFIDPNQSKTLKKRQLILTLSSQSRLALHFRWK